MNFGSKYVYYYNHSDSESVSAGSDSCEDSSSDSEPYPVVASAGFGSSFMQKLSSPFRKGKKSRSKKRVDPGFHTDGGPPMLQHDGAPMAGQVGPSRRPAGAQLPDKKKKNKKKVRKADPNVFTVSVGKYVSAENAVSDQKTIRCGTCKAVLPSFSKFEVKEGTNNWLCEFCRSYNRDVDVEGWTKPTGDDITYELQPPVVVECKEKKLTDNSNIIFVIDISGSMGCTVDVDQVDSSGRRTRTFVSRLDAVKKAAEHQMRQIRDETPNVGVGLISFGSRVGVYGDGTTNVSYLEGRDIATPEELKAVASDFPNLKPIKETFNAITGKLVNLDIRGSTALGPGLLAGISLAANVKGSKVIICTDGCANVGFGALPDDYCADEERISASRAVYKGFGDYARDHGVTVSVISLEGTDCRLVHLGMVAQITGGVVDIVDPTNMSAQFGNILASRTLATDVTVNMILYHTLYIRDFQSTEQTSTKVEQLGNVSEDSEIIVEFGVKTVSNENEEPVPINDEDNPPPPPPSDEEKMVNSAAVSSNDQQEKEENCAAATSADEDNSAATSANQLNNMDTTTSCVQPQEMDTGDTVVEDESEHPSELPFQVQIDFTSRAGGKYLRVITNLRESTARREEAELEMNMNIVGAATSNTVSNVALTGDYAAARGAIQTRKKMTERYAKVLPAGASASLMDDVEEYEQDLEDLTNLVAKQERTTKQKASRLADDGSSFATDGAPATRTSSACYSNLQHDGASPLPYQMVQSAGMARSAGPSKAVKKGASANFISDDLAYEYYARSKGSYAQKKKMKDAKK